MTYIKKYGSALLWNILEILAFMLLFTAFYHFNIINEKVYSFCKLCILLGSVFINSLIIGKRSLKKGYLEGIKYGICVILCFIIPCLYFYKLRLILILFYGLILMTSVTGSIIGIQRKKRN